MAKLKNNLTSQGTPACVHSLALQIVTEIRNEKGNICIFWGDSLQIAHYLHVLSLLPHPMQVKNRVHLPWSHQYREVRYINSKARVHPVSLLADNVSSCGCHQPQSQKRTLRVFLWHVHAVIHSMSRDTLTADLTDLWTSCLKGF